MDETEPSDRRVRRRERGRAGIGRERELEEELFEEKEEEEEEEEELLEEEEERIVLRRGL